ncbi:MAG: hypothetical protein ACE5KD_04705 [Candidatus Bathyarchaeia archaeon]
MPLRVETMDVKRRLKRKKGCGEVIISLLAKIRKKDDKMLKK